MIDTPGSLSALQDAAVLAADLLISPLPPEMLSAREFSRGTIAMLERLRPMERMRIPVPPLAAVLNRIDRTRNAAEIASTVRHELFCGSASQIRLLETAIPNLVAYREAATLGIPVHRYEPRRPAGRTSPSALETMESLVRELLPATIPADPKSSGYCGRRTNCGGIRKFLYLRCWVSSEVYPLLSLTPLDFGATARKNGIA